VVGGRGQWQKTGMYVLFDTGLSAALHSSPNPTGDIDISRIYASSRGLI